MQGYIANTDPDWHAQLLARQRTSQVEEVNFWKPSETSRFKALRPGEPFLFRLNSPHNAIGGLGFFEGFSVLPAWLAWETFGPGNGVRDLPEFERRLREIRARNRPAIGAAPSCPERGTTSRWARARGSGPSAGNASAPGACRSWPNRSPPPQIGAVHLRSFDHGSGKAGSAWR